MSLTPILLTIIAVLNLFSLLIMGNDKSKSMRGGTTERTPEGIIFFVAALFGSIGVYIGMFLFRHKINKWYFQLGIPVLIIQNLAQYTYSLNL